MDSILKDDRFKRIATDRRFRGGSKKQRKVKVDKRFNSMFKEEKFVSKCTVDKRGRPNNFSSKENYRKYYDLKGSDESESEDEVEDEDDEHKHEADKDAEENQGRRGSDSEDDEGSDAAEGQQRSDDEDWSDSEDEYDGLIEPTIKEKLRNGAVDYARGEANLYSDSSSDESSEGEDVEEEEGFSKWGELDADAERTEEITRRLALCNMDWDRVQADDIFLALSSFCPSTGCVKQVDVFLSEFGAERLKEEDSLGPQELRRRKEQEAKDEEDYLDLVKSGRKAAKLEKEAMERVRQYQINRLKYYYAIIQFDSPDTANSVYEECDGMEYELSATRFDLRFVPDDMEFGEPSSSCHSLPNPDQYKPKTFMTTALQQQKVELTWDETDASRQEVMKKAYDLLDEDDDVARNLIASSSEDEDDEPGHKKDANDEGEEEGDDEDSISKYRALLKEITNNDQAEDKNLEVTWNPEEDGDQEEAEAETEENLTPWEKYLKKKKDKKKKKKALKTQTDDDIPEDVDMDDPFFAEELGDQKQIKKKKKKVKRTEDGPSGEKATDLDLLVMDSDEEDKHFNYKTIVEDETKTKSKKKWKKKKKKQETNVTAAAVDNFDVDVNDDRFAAIFSRPEYNIDPSEQNFKKTKGMEKLIGEKQKRIQSGRNHLPPQPKKSKLDPELSASLKSVKNKWEKNAKKKKT